MKSSATRYLVAAIIWTVIAIFAAIVLFFYSDATGFGKGCAIVLIIMCVAGQWLRYRKMK